mmetsp:Transcript_82012/g.253434  ORF Transcript_82012/g.253434 Transcript_82012/m.253434 type:complete len:204 (-) Transcript_82012:328-939(-)
MGTLWNGISGPMRTPPRRSKAAASRMRQSRMRPCGSQRNPAAGTRPTGPYGLCTNVRCATRTQRTGSARQLASSRPGWSSGGLTPRHRCRGRSRRGSAPSAPSSRGPSRTRTRSGTAGRTRSSSGSRRPTGEMAWSECAASAPCATQSWTFRPPASCRSLAGRASTPTACTPAQRPLRRGFRPTGVCAASAGSTASVATTSLA